VALEVGIHHALGGVDEHLLDLRQGLQGLFTAGGVVGGHHAPAQDLEALGGQLFFQLLAGGIGQGRVLVEEHHAHGIQFAHGEAFGLGDIAHESIRFFQQQAASVAGLAVGGDGATVGHATQGIDGGLHQPVAGLGVHLGDEAEAAVIPLERGAIQTCELLLTHFHGQCSKQ